jgi:hypothetical protein
MFTRPTNRPSRALALVLALALLIAACGSSNDSQSSVNDAMGSRDSGGGDGGSSADASTGEAERPSSPNGDSDDGPLDLNVGGGGATVPGDATSASRLTPADFGRSIVYVARTEVMVEDVPSAVSQAKTAMASLGGLLFGEQTQTGEVSRTTLDFRVLPEDFQEALRRLEGLGEFESQEVTVDDVTERVVDLRSRVATSEVSVERLRDLLSGAKNLEDVARLETQLLERETALETLRGQLRTVEGQVDLATILLTLREPAPPAIDAELDYEVTFADGDEGGENCAGSFDELEVDEGDTFTVCVTITNVGNTPVGDIEVRDHGLDLRGRDFQLIDAPAELVLGVGATAVAWAATEAPAKGGSAVAVAGVAYDDDGESLRIGAQTERVSDGTVRFNEDNSVPSFLDGLAASGQAIIVAATVSVLLAGFLLPFAIVIVPLGWWGRRRWAKRQQTQATEVEGAEAPLSPDAR